MVAEFSTWYRTAVLLVYFEENLFSQYLYVYITLLIVIKYRKLKVLYLNRSKFKVLDQVF